MSIRSAPRRVTCLLVHVSVQCCGHPDPVVLLHQRDVLVAMQPMACELSGLYNLGQYYSDRHQSSQIQGRPGTARHAGPADLWHGPARKIMARKNIGTARHGKSWHGKIMARHGPEKYHKHFLEKMFFGRKIRFCPDPKSHF